jgi:hypothetical protein
LVDILPLFITDQPDKLADWTSCMSKLSDFLEFWGNEKILRNQKSKMYKPKLMFGSNYGWA